MNSYLSQWPGIAQVAQLTRTVTKDSKTSHEIVYLITNLTPIQASPRRLLDLIRGHWSIENSLHDVRDVTFAEDHCRIRTGNAPHVLAAVRHLVVTLLHRSGASSLAAARRHFAYHPRQALDFLLSAAPAQQ